MSDKTKNNLTVLLIGNILPFGIVIWLFYSNKISWYLALFILALFLVIDAVVLRHELKSKNILGGIKYNKKDIHNEIKAYRSPYFVALCVIGLPILILLIKISYDKNNIFSGLLFCAIGIGATGQLIMGSRISPFGRPIITINNIVIETGRFAIEWDNIKSINKKSIPGPHKMFGNALVIETTKDSILYLKPMAYRFNKIINAMVSTGKHNVLMVSLSHCWPNYEYISNESICIWQTNVKNEKFDG